MHQIKLWEQDFSSHGNMIEEIKGCKLCFQSYQFHLLGIWFSVVISSSIDSFIYEGMDSILLVQIRLEISILNKKNHAFSYTPKVCNIPYRLAME